MIKRLLSYLYYIFFKYIVKNESKSNIGKWFYKNGDKKYLLNHNLNENDVIFDIGGYTGVFTKKLVNKFNSEIYVFEPVEQYFKELEKKFNKFENVKLYNYGLSSETKKANITINEDGSSVLQKSENMERIKLVSIEDFMSDNNVEKVHLATINIEGGEFELLNSILEKDLIKRFDFIQVQFHSFVDDSEKLRETIITRLLKTHKPTFSYPFVWEGFELRK